MFVVFRIVQVAAHPKGREGNVMGRQASGRGCVQLWEVRTGGGGQLVGSPRMAMAACHDGGVAWDAKWCPLGPTAADGAGAAPGSQDEGLPG